MSELKTEPALATWSVPETPLTIEYSLHTLGEIREYTVLGLRQLSRGGVEVGGILYGARGENMVRILSWRPLACEHSRGPAFLLSPADRTALSQALEHTKPDPELSGMHAIGWFVSHTRAGLQLTDSDLKLFNHYFPWSWQIALVVQPRKVGPAKAGFFVRGAEGQVKADASYQEFEIEPAAAPVKPVEAAAKPKNYYVSEPASEPAENSRLTDRRLWIWAAPVVLGIMVWAVIWGKQSPHSLPPEIGLHVLNNGNDLRLEWDKNAELVREAGRGVLTLRDGASATELDLSGEQLRGGNVTYTRRTGDVEVKMTVYPAKGSPAEESARFIGPPVTPLIPGTLANAERESLQREVRRLRDELRKQTNRNRELEHAVRILENRKEVERVHKLP